MGGSVGITTHDGHAGQRRAVLRADDVYDALARVTHTELGDAEMVAVLLQRGHLKPRNRIVNARAVGSGRYIVIGYRKNAGRTPRLAPGQMQPLEGLRRSDLVHQMPVDVDQRIAAFSAVDNVLLPKFIVEGLFEHGVNWMGWDQIGWHRISISANILPQPTTETAVLQPEIRKKHGFPCLALGGADEKYCGNAISAVSPSSG